MVKRSLLLSLLVVSAVAGLLWTLSPLERADPDNRDTALQPKTVNFFHYFSGSLNGGIEAMVAEVNASSREYTVLASPLDHEAFKTMVPAAFEHGDPPALFSYWAGEKVRQLVAHNRLVPIDDLFEHKHLQQNFSQALIDSAITYEGKKYLLPITQHIVVFFYNKHLFNKLGLSPPETWHDFLTLCSKLHEQDIIPIALGARERWPAQFWFDYLLLRTAGPEFREQLMRGKRSYTDPEVISTYKIWSDLLLQGYFNSDANQLDWDKATDLVRHGDAAMTLMGSWAIPLLEQGEEKPQPGRDFDFFSFPAINTAVPLVSVGPIDGIVLSRDSEHPEFAKEVLAHFASGKAQQLMSEGSGGFAPDNTIPADFYSPFKRRLKQEIDRSAAWAFNYDLATDPAVADRGMDSFNELIEFPGQYQIILQDLQHELTAP